MERISVDEWLEELRRISEHNDEGLSKVEWGEKLGIGVDTVTRRLKKASKLGMLRCGFRTATSLDGKKYRLPVYSVLAPKAQAA